jgi:hypothetical protein
MKKNLSLLLTVLLCLATINAQNNSEGVKKHQLKVNLLAAPNIDYEFGISEYATLSLQIGTELGSVKNIKTNKSHIGLFPLAEISFRQYYKYDRRIAKGKNIVNNSANYYGIIASYISADAIIIDGNINVIHDLFQAGGVYGFQRTYFKKLNLGFETGVVYGYSEFFGGQVQPYLNFNLGWLLL